MISVAESIIRTAKNLKNKYAASVFGRLVKAAIKKGAFGKIQFQNFSEFAAYFNLGQFDGRARHLFAVANVCNINKYYWVNMSIQEKASIVISHLTIHWNNENSEQHQHDNENRNTNKNKQYPTENRNTNKQYPTAEQMVMMLGILYIIKSITFQIDGVRFFGFVLSNSNIGKEYLYPLIVEILDKTQLSDLIAHNNYMQKHKNLNDNSFVNIERLILFNLNKDASGRSSDELIQNMVTLQCCYGVKIEQLSDRDQCVSYLRKIKDWILKTPIDNDEFFSKYEIWDVQSTKTKILDAMNTESSQFVDSDLMNVYREIEAQKKRNSRQIKDD